MNKRIWIITLLSLLLALIMPELIFYNTDDDIELINLEYNGVEDKEHQIKDILTFFQNVEYTTILAVNKDNLSEEIYNELIIELGKLKELNLINLIYLPDLRDNLVYVAYHNYVSDSQTVGIVEYKFSDFNMFEYTFWVDSINGTVYEVSIIDDTEFAIAEQTFMDSLRSYYRLDEIKRLSYETFKWRFELNQEDQQSEAFLLEYSIYDAGDGKFVSKNNGISWCIFSKSLSRY